MKKTILPILATMFAAAMLMLAGCASAPPVDPRLTLGPGVASQLTVEPLATRALARDVTEVRLTVQNRDSSKPRVFEYKVEWRDVQGFPISTVTGDWTRFAAPAGAQQTLSIVGPSPDAVKFNIYIRKAAN